MQAHISAAKITSASRAIQNSKIDVRKNVFFAAVQGRLCAAKMMALALETPATIIAIDDRKDEFFTAGQKPLGIAVHNKGTSDPDPI